MAFHSVCILFMLSAQVVWGQQYDGPKWPIEDLEKLEHDHVSAWRFELNKKGKLKNDSTLNYAFQFNKRTRTLSGIHWGLIQREDGTLDTLNIVEVLIQFDAKGEVISSVTRKSDLSDMLGPRSREIVVRKELRTEAGLIIHRSYQQFHGASDSATANHEVSMVPDYWSMDTTIFQRDRPLREISISRACPECPIRVDSTVYAYEAEDTQWTRSTSYRGGRVDHLSWRQFSGDDLIHRVDSSLIMDYDSTWFKLPLFEWNYVYDNGLLVEKETINWTDSFQTWMFLPGQRHVPRDQPTRLPVREVERIEYRNDELLRTQYVTERNGIRDSVVHEHTGIDPLDVINAQRITKRTASGLPLVITGEQIIVIRPFQNRPQSVIHVHYDDKQPAGIPELQALGEYLQIMPYHLPIRSTK
jgi:hypothetical protein